MNHKIDPETTNLPPFLIGTFQAIQDRFRRTCDPVIKRHVIVGRGGSTENLLFETKDGTCYMIAFSPLDRSESKMDYHEWLEAKAEEAIHKGLTVTLKFADKLFTSTILNA